MFCRKCGNEIPDDSVFCLKCGAKIENIEKKENTDIQNEKVISIAAECVDEPASVTTKETVGIQETKKSRAKFVCLFLFIVIGIFIAITLSEESKRCDYNECDNLKIENGEYCYSHTCNEEGCVQRKSLFGSYCYTHEAEYACAEEDCDNYKMSGGEYCYSHTCDESGCYNEIVYGTKYCKEHQVDMRALLELDRFYINRINSAGGIEICFNATNKNAKEIKYIRFYVELYNTVGDRIEDEITDKNSVYVEITGPVKRGASVEFKDIIGYNDTCGKVVIRDITIVYMDGTSYTGHYGYYAD